jgi:hypothetical protein
MWSLIFALPNVDLREAFGNDYIAIAPRSDPRVTAITAADATTRRFVEAFQDQFGHKVDPAVLIANQDGTRSPLSTEAMVAFRNALSLTIIIEAHELSLDRGLPFYPHYTDYFDFYPITVARHENGFLTSSPAVLGFADAAENFAGQTAPELAAPTSVSLGLEKDLLSSIDRLWVKRFIRGRTGEWSTRCLFRSLEMAYQAASMPFANHSSIYDFGTAASLWVSAFEILARPRAERAGLMSVLRLLGRYDWGNRVIRRKAYRLIYDRRPLSLNLVQRLYADIYNARNAFLHGNPVTPADLYPFRRKGRIPITRFAPLLYKVALLCFLGGPARPLGSNASYRQYARRSAKEFKLADAILEARQRV